jgi:hypothetical protein
VSVVQKNENSIEKSIQKIKKTARNKKTLKIPENKARLKTLLFQTVPQNSYWMLRFSIRAVKI